VLKQYNTSKDKIPIKGNSTTHQKLNANYREQYNTSTDKIPITVNSTIHQKITYQLQGTEQLIKR
jgi:hypothetical protein